MPLILNGRVQKKNSERSRGGEVEEKILKRVEEFHVCNISIPESPFQSLDKLHDLNASGVSPSHPPPPYVNN